MKLHTGDHVVIISGKDKGRTGTIMRVLHLKDRVVVSGINMRTRHMRKTAQQAGQRIQYEASIHVSNVMLVDPKTKKRTRIGAKIDEKGNKKRVAKASGELLPTKNAGGIAKATKTKAAPLKEAKETKEAKEGAKKGEPQIERQDAPPKKDPFWKRMVRFGADAEGGEPQGTVKSEDHSIPAETPTKQQYQRSSGRSQ